MYQVNVYTDARDRSPFLEWLDELDKKAAKKIYYAVERLEQDGTWVARDVEDGIWELRPEGYRVLFFHAGDGKYVILHGFAKKTPKTPKREIDKAKHERADWLNRYGQ